MDAAKNPFAPGAGTRPPELAGRERIVSDSVVALRRVQAARPAKSQMLLGLRGVGKTVLLNHILELAEGEGYLTVYLEAPENRSLAEMLVPPLRSVLFKLSRAERAKNVANRGLGILRGFASAFEVRYGELEVGVRPEPGTADSGQLEADLPELLLAVALAAKADERAVALFIDEVQYLSAEDLSALIVSVHRIGQRGLPFIVFGAGLPQLAALAGEAKSYAERLFDYPPVGALDPDAAKRAIREPIVGEGAKIEPQALEEIVRKTEGYPYFLQEWGSHAWNTASRSPITLADVRSASKEALAALDAGFFRVRLDRLTPRERDYTRAMAELGPGPHRSGDIAGVLGIGVTTAAPLRNGLIRKGMIYSPAHGDTAFTVPMFDAFLKRSMPDWTPSLKLKKRPRRGNEL
ncbi:MAG TPA: ATP-binding protein [Gemmatimonadaceae bacterium]|nr:ATP-binding protein [Gemmatimonadaceae bacterium]